LNGNLRDAITNRQPRLLIEVTDCSSKNPITHRQFRLLIEEADDAMNIQQMMKQAQQMQERLQKQMAELRVEATAGGGMVAVVMSGQKQVLSLKLDPEVVSKDDVEMLQDLIVAAINDAHRKVDEAMSEQMGGLMGGMKLPGMF
jgi:nucleoid-associated protein EbfC